MVFGHALEHACPDDRSRESLRVHVAVGRDVVEAW